MIKMEEEQEYMTIMFDYSDEKQKKLIDEIEESCNKLGVKFGYGNFE